LEALVKEGRFLWGERLERLRAADEEFSGDQSIRACLIELLLLTDDVQSIQHGFAREMVNGQS
jgi:hypothetical protein